MDELILPFQTYAGKVQIEPTNETMTPFGGLVPWAAFTKKTKIFESLANTSPVDRTSNNALPCRYDKIRPEPPKNQNSTAEFRFISNRLMKIRRRQ